MEFELLNLEETAEFLHQPVATLRHWRASNDPTKPQGRRIGRRVMFRKADLEQFVNSVFDNAEVAS
jgi:predicted DNA-binding transcriptional regulator AlpA